MKKGNEIVEGKPNMQLRGILGRLGVAALALATLAGGSVFATSTAHAQAPQSVPVARFYGQALGPVGATVVNLTILGQVAGITCTATQAGVAGAATVSGGQYMLDIQAIPGCTTPGATVVFTAGSYRAKETGTIPDLPGTAVHLNLNFQLPATPTAAPPPPPPPSTPRPSTPAAPPPTTAPARTVTPVAQRPVTQGAAAAPKGPVAVAPRLPSTGTGGLLDQQSSNSGLAAGALALIVLAALGASAMGMVAYRRSSH